MSTDCLVHINFYFMLHPITRIAITITSFDFFLTFSQILKNGIRSAFDIVKFLSSMPCWTYGTKTVKIKGRKSVTTKQKLTGFRKERLLRF